MKSQSHNIGSSNYYIALKFDRHINSTAAKGLVKFKSDRTILQMSQLRDFVRSHDKTSHQIMKQGLVPIYTYIWKVDLVTTAHLALLATLARPLEGTVLITKLGLIFPKDFLNINDFKTYFALFKMTQENS